MAIRMRAEVFGTWGRRNMLRVFSFGHYLQIRMINDGGESCTVKRFVIQS